jgi:parallel beta-helix repeat protein
MQPQTMFRQIGRKLALKRGTAHARRPRRRVLELESIEGRVMLSTLFVSTSGSYGDNTAYKTIQAAVASDPPSGSTIEVAPGSYSGTVVVNEPLVFLGAEANVNPTVSGARTSPANESTLNGMFEVEASDVTINGFTVQNGKTEAGISDALGDSGTVLDYNIISGTYDGVHSAAGDTTIEYNLIENAATDGIDLGDESGAGIYYNLIENNGFTSASGASEQGQGMLLSSITSGDIYGNQVLNNHTDGIEVVLSSSNLTIEDNTVSGQGGMGIALSNSTSITVYGNVVDSNGAGGICLLDANGNTIEVNAADYNGTVGIGLQSSNGTDVLDNSTYGNDTAGISLVSSDNNAVEDNTSEANLAQGVVLSDSVGNGVNSNVIEHNLGDGIDNGDDAGTESDYNGFNYNTIEYNGFLPDGQESQSQGMLFSTVSWDVIYDNTVSNNHTDGIEVVISSSHVLVSDNTVASNGGDGIALSNNNGGTVEYNTVSGSGASGIHFESVTGVTVYDNTVSNSVYDGIWLDANSTGNTVSDNSMSGDGHLDAEDDSVGDLTAGTANTWTGNHGKTDNHGGGLV